MTFDTHLSMTTHKMGEYWFSEDVKFQFLRNTFGIAVKLSEWSHDVGVVTRNIVFADVEHKEEGYLSCLSSDYDEHVDLLTDAEDLVDTDSEGSVHHLGIEPYQ